MLWDSFFKIILWHTHLGSKSDQNWQDATVFRYPPLSENIHMFGGKHIHVSDYRVASTDPAVGNKQFMEKRILLRFWNWKNSEFQNRQTPRILEKWLSTHKSFSVNFGVLIYPLRNERFLRFSSLWRKRGGEGRSKTSPNGGSQENKL